MDVGGAEVRNKTEILDMVSQAIGLDYRAEESTADESARVGDVSLMVELLGEPKIRLTEGIDVLVKQRFKS